MCAGDIFLTLAGYSITHFTPLTTMPFLAAQASPSFCFQIWFRLVACCKNPHQARVSLFSCSLLAATAILCPHPSVVSLSRYSPGIFFSPLGNFLQRLIALHWSSSSVWKPWEREWGQKGREIKSWGEWASNYTPTNAICGTSTGKWTLSLSLSLSLIITKDRVSSGLPFFSDSRSSTQGLALIKDVMDGSNHHLGISLIARERERWKEKSYRRPRNCSIIGWSLKKERIERERHLIRDFKFWVTV